MLKIFPIAMACAFNNCYVASSFANSELPPYVAAENFNQSLVAASSNNDINSISKLLTNADINSQAAANGTTPLMAASMDGNVGLVKTMLARGAVVDLKDFRGETALKYALSANKMDVAQLLLENGASTSFLGADEAKFLEYMQNYPKNWSSAYILPDDYRLLYTSSELQNNLTEIKLRYDFQDSLVNAADKGDIAEVKKLLDAGYNINQAGKYGTTALMRAAYNNDVEMLKLLLAYGAKVNVVDNFGMSALAAANLKNNQPVSKILADNGANAQLYAVFEPAAAPLVVAGAAGIGGLGTAGTTAAAVGGAVVATGAGVAIVDANSGGSNTASSSSNSNSGSGSGGSSGGGTGDGAGGGPGGGDGSPDCTVITCAEQAATGKDVKIAIIGTGVQNVGPYNFTNISGQPDSTDNYETATYNFKQANSNGVVVWDNNGKDFFTPGISADDGTPEPGSASMPDGTSSQFHDTETALIINKIASDAVILSVRAFSGQGFMISPNSQIAVSRAIRYAVDNNAKIINNSWGINSTSGGDMTSATAVADANSRLNASTNAQGQLLDDNDEPLPPEFGDGNTINSIKHAIDNKVVMVWAAGNSGANNPNVTAGLYAIHPELNSNPETAKYWLIAGAVAPITDQNDELIAVDINATGSNRCGVAKDRCLVVIANSTSKSAAQVSAAVAKVIEAGAASGLTTDQAAARVLNTAIYIDENGVLVDGVHSTNDIYGHGLLSPGLALSEYGLLFANNGSSSPNSVLLSGSKIKLGSAFGDALIKNNIKFIAFDNNGDKNSEMGSANFVVNLNNMVGQTNNSLNYDQAFKQFGTSGFTEKVDYASSQLQFTPYTAGNDLISPEEKPNFLGNFAYKAVYDNFMNYSKSAEKQTANELSFGLSHNVKMDRFFGFMNTDGDDISNTINPYAKTNPYLGFANEALNSFAGVRFDDVAFKFGAFSGRENDEYNHFNESIAVSGSVFGADYHVADTVFSLQAGQVTEQGAFLGSQMDGAFMVNDTTPTKFYAFGIDHALTNDIEIYGYYAHGVSEMSPTADSLFSNISNIESDAYSIGASYKGLESDKSTVVGVNFSQPLRVSKATASFSYADNQQNQHVQNLDLTPSGRETDIEAFIAKDLGPKTKAGFSSMYRTEPGNNSNAADETMLMFKFLHRF